MAEETIKLAPGDLVKLKSGGPTMTVRHQDSRGGGWICTWWNEVKSEYSETGFWIQQLKKVEE